MNRLTKRIDGSLVFPSELIGVVMTPSNDAMCQILTRLAAYEDTGLEPEEIKNALDVNDIIPEINVTVDHIRDLIHAEQDGRLVVLPCKTGDKVLVDARTLPYNYLHPADGCGSFAKCEIVAIVTTKKETYLKLRALYPSRAGRRDYLKYGVTAIGKTVFLTREEAEAALGGKGGEGNA